MLFLAFGYVFLFASKFLLNQAPDTLWASPDQQCAKLWARQLDLTATATSSTGAPYAVVRHAEFGDGKIDLPSSFNAGTALVATSETGQNLWARSVSWGTDYNPLFSLIVSPETGGPVLVGKAGDFTSVYVDSVEVVTTPSTDLIIAMKPVLP